MDKMLSNYFRVVFILVAICIAWNEVAAQTGMHGIRSGVKSGVRGYRPPYDPKTFIGNFFHTPCRENEESTDCQMMEGETCWEPEGPNNSYPCRDGCDCVTGYLRNSWGLCVLEEHCDTKRKPMYYVEPLQVHMNRYMRYRKTPPGVRP